VQVTGSLDHVRVIPHHNRIYRRRIADILNAGQQTILKIVVEHTQYQSVVAVENQSGNHLMTEVEDYDVVVLGSGFAGKSIGWTMAKRDKRTAVIERQYIGGACPNVACLPSKNFIHSAKVIGLFRRATEFGIETGPWKIHMPAIRQRKRDMVDYVIKSHLDRYHQSGADLIMGEGRFVAPRTIEVKTTEGTRRILRGDIVVINTGSRARIADIEGLAESRPLTHVEAYELDRIPEHLIVIGGGFVGLELAQTFRRFGSQVTLIERNEALAHKQDDDVRDELQTLFANEGIFVLTTTSVVRVEGRSGERVKVYIDRDGKSQEIEGSDILVANGRLPNTENLGLELAGVEIDNSGYIRVDERLRTTEAQTWAAGDCAGSPHFTHAAHHDFRIICDNFAGANLVTTGRQVPFCLFTDPEFGKVGIDEKEAQGRGIAYRKSKILVRNIRRANTIAENRGFFKLLVDHASDQILGFTGIGPNVEDVLGVVQLAVEQKLPYTVLRDAIFPHPTMTESMFSLCMGISALAPST
jgi:pyruvate/2-oxoglutarate dehydrogenase complex dihydrolipoamide dehydrogenase (E3) component